MLSDVGSSVFRLITHPLVRSGIFPLVMPGLVPGIHVLMSVKQKTWMAGTKPGHDDTQTHIRAPATRRAPGLCIYRSPEK